MPDSVHYPGWPENRAAIIAEVGMNHGGDETLAWEMILAAHEGGADLIKLQIYSADKTYHASLSYQSELKRMALSRPSVERLFERANGAGIHLFATAFDDDSLALVDRFAPPAHKIASMDFDNPHWIEQICRTGRVVIISCGMADLEDLNRSVAILQREAPGRTVLLHCIAEYPAAPGRLHLSRIPFLRERYGLPIGYSDHAIGIDAISIALAHGACAIEKHFTIDRRLAEQMPEADHDISMDPSDLRQIRHMAESVASMWGNPLPELTEKDRLYRRSIRRGLYAARDLAAGEALSSANTAFLRPIADVPASDWLRVAGASLRQPVPSFQPIRYDNLILPSEETKP